jgi:hypothetical protein
MTLHVCIVCICCTGRINKKVFMGNLAAAEALAMVKHYFPDINQQQQLRDGWTDGVVSPAALEALCAEFDDVDGLLVAVQQLLASVTGNDSKNTAGRMSHSKQRQQPQQQQGQQGKLDMKMSAAAAACCEGSAGASGSCVIIRASSCAASFGAGGCGGSSLFDAAAAAAAYQEHS